MTKKIFVKNTKNIAIVDDEDYQLVSAYHWKLSHNGYAVCGACEKIRMHRIIMGDPEKFEVDHINGNKLDNRRENLRLATRHQNMRNRGPLSTNKTGYKGVSKFRSGFKATISVNKRTKIIGVFSSAEEAARAYDEVAKILFGEFAWLNFPRQAQRPDIVSP
jgi:hypothetical protein